MPRKKGSKDRIARVNSEERRVKYSPKDYTPRHMVGEYSLRCRGQVSWQYIQQSLEALAEDGDPTVRKRLKD